MNNTFTITFPYYEAPEMLAHQLAVMKKYPEWSWEYLRLIVVDDGSPINPAEKVFLTHSHPPCPVELYRIQEDIPWNHGGARNLAFDRMKEGWAVLTDIDHVLPLESVCSMLTMPLSPGQVYIPARYRMLGVLDWEEIPSHSDSFILTREMYWEIGGYDEDFSGYWNGVSGLFRKALKRKAEFKKLEYVNFLLYGTDLIPDANVTSLGRKGSEYDIKKMKNTELRMKYMNATGGRSTPKKPLRFNWERVL